MSDKIKMKVKPVFSMEDEASIGSVLWGYHRQNCTGEKITTKLALFFSNTVRLGEDYEDSFFADLK